MLTLKFSIHKGMEVLKLKFLKTSVLYFLKQFNSISGQLKTEKETENERKIFESIIIKSSYISYYYLSYPIHITQL